MSIAEYRIDVPPSSVRELAQRIGATRWPDEPAEVGWRQGIPLARMRELAAGLAAFDWPAEQARLNELEHVVATIDGARVHALHVRADEAQAPVLVLLHGWPGTFADYLPLVERLRGRYHVVVPSLPGFGFSGPVAELGWGAPRIAAAVGRLMSELGYERYLVHGEDLGAIAARHLATSRPESLAGIHVTNVPGIPVPDGVELSEEDQRRAGMSQRYMHTYSGYAMVQSQAPMTLAYGLMDSPAGLLAWIGEKLLCWSDPQTVPADEDVLRNVSIYWHTRTIASSARVYWEGAADWGSRPEPWTVPTGVAAFPDPLGMPIRPALEQLAPIVHWTEHERGGHFSMLEVPDALAADIDAFAGRVLDADPRATHTS